MSERKDAEIKFRVTPTEKARWQAFAASADLGLSELIRREVNEGIRQNEAQQADALRAIEALRERGAGDSGAVKALEPCRGDGMEGVPLCAPCVEAGGCKLPAEHEVALTDTAIAALEAYGGLPVVLSEEMPAGMCLITNIGDAAAPQEDVPTSDEVGANEKKPWMFEARDA